MPGFELFDETEKQQIDEVLNTGVLMRYGFDGQRQNQWKALALENQIATYCGCSFAHLTSSGTAALTTALTSLGIGFEDEVIMPSFTFVASFEAVLSVGAIPVLVDIDDSLTIHPAAVLKAITPKTKCIMVVHMCGSMAAMDELLNIAQQRNILLLEDACQSMGATYKGKHLGSLGHVGCLSFDYVKTITCGEGGALITNQKNIYTTAQQFTDHGHDHMGTDRGADLHPIVGYNFRISELHAAIGLAQIKKLPRFLEIQRKNHAQLKTILSSVPQIRFRTVPDPAGDSGSFLSWMLPNQHLTQQVVAAMKAQNSLAGHFYWFDNNWHYVRKWQHLKSNAFLNSTNPAIKKSLERLSIQDFSSSDAVMSCCISTAISLKWTPAQIEEKGLNMVKIISSVF